MYQAKLRVLDENRNVLGETGLIKPGEYVKSVALNTLPDAGTKISLKIMGYEPETYRSAGNRDLLLNYIQIGVRILS